MTRRLALLLLLLPVAAAAEPLEADSAAGLYHAVLEPAAEPVPVNALHAWTVTLTDAAGAPVDGAEIAVGGGMPAHGHGLPTAPAVTEEMGEGRYLIEGVRFNMTGEWEVTLSVTTDLGTDEVVVRFTL
jgi:hypothetical protein